MGHNHREPARVRAQPRSAADRAGRLRTDCAVDGEATGGLISGHDGRHLGVHVIGWVDPLSGHVDEGEADRLQLGARFIGATLAFLVSRFVLRDSVQAKFGDKLKADQRGVDKEGGFYLFTLRLVPAFPFFVINLAMGLTSMKTWTFYWVSQLGMLLGTIVYVNAGTELGRSSQGIFRRAHRCVRAARRLPAHREENHRHASRRARSTRKWQKPAQFDRNVVVIGAGSAGLVTSYIAAAVKAKVTLVETPQDGRRLPEHRLRALEGADPFGEVAVAHQARAGIRHQERHGGVRFRGGHGARAAGGRRPSSRTIRSSATPLSAWSASRATAKIMSPWTVEVDAGRRQQADADHEEHRDRGRRAAFRAADSGAEEVSPLPPTRSGICASCPSASSCWAAARSAPSSPNASRALARR